MIDSGASGARLPPTQASSGHRMYEPAPYVPLPTWPAIWLSLAFAAAIAMAEVDRLVGDVLDLSGASWSFTGVFGPGRALDPVGGQATWSAWRNVATPAPPITGLLTFYLLFDAVYVVGLLGAVLCAVNRRHTAPRRIVIALAIFDVVEGLGAEVERAWAGGAESLGAGLGFVTLMKWLLYVALLVALAWSIWDTDKGARLVRIGYGLVRQRFSALALLVVAALSIASGPNLLDQLPDVERRWLDDGVGYRQLGMACAALVLLAVALFALGRLRGDQVWRRAIQQRSDLKKASWRPWVGMVVGLGSLAIVVRLFGGVIDPRPLIILAAVLLLVPLLSWAAERWGPERGPVAWPYEAEADGVAIAVIGVGDVLAVLAVVLGGVGCVRSFTAPAVLPIVGLTDTPSGPLSAAVLPVISVVIGFGAATATWLIAGWILRCLDNDAHREPDADAADIASAAAAAGPEPGAKASVRRRVAVSVTPGGPRVSSAGVRAGVRSGLAVVGGSVILVIGAVPGSAASGLGVIASFVLSVLGLVIVLGVALVVSHDRRPQAVFRLLRLRTTPIVTLLLVAAVATWYQSSYIVLHGIGDLGAATGNADPRLSFDDAFSNWENNSSTCGHESQPNGAEGLHVQVRPMVLVSAAGGGIRATYWTASAMARITATAPPSSCGPQAVFLSSGVSGSSLALAAIAGARPATVTNTVAATDLATPDALGAATIGLLLRDGLAGLTGIHLPTIDQPDGPVWQDRSGLMESAWTRQLPGLSDQFIPTDTHSRTPAGQLILNTTSVGTGCRVLISQMRLDQRRPDDPPIPSSITPAPVSGDPQCRSGATVLPASFDLLSDYRYQSRSIAGDQCIRGLTLASAAMLSARFAYVTPSGVVGPCADFTPQQLIDGGYAESSGLGTVIDLAPRWLDRVRTVNDATLAALSNGAAPGGQGTTENPLVFVVPIIVALQNGYGSDITPSTSKLTTEIQVPIVGQQAAAAQDDVATLLQRATQLTASANLCGSASTALCGRLAETIPTRVVVVAPDTVPAVIAPLGWVLSRDSRISLDAALNDQASRSCSPPDIDTPACRGRYGRLVDLLNEIRTPVAG